MRTGYPIGAESNAALAKAHSAAQRIAKLLQFHPKVTASTPFIADAYPNDPELRTRYFHQLQDAGLSRRFQN
jgi:hypothetical protein